MTGNEKNTVTLHNKLLDIQQRLKVPKDNNNDFGGFKYRNIEDIEDKLKPLLKEHDLTLVFNDKMLSVGDRVYVEATATLSDGVDNIQASACAREATSPKAKTDDAQLTGGCSSYARKYAASGLFLIDNTKDADSQGSPSTTVKPTAKPITQDVPASLQQKNLIKQLLEQQGIVKADMPQFLQDEFGIIPGQTLWKADASNIINELLQKTGKSNG